MASQTSRAHRAHYYAIAHRYGAGTVHANTGERIGAYYAFPSAAARDAWVADGPSYRGDHGAREVVPAHDREIRALIRGGERDCAAHFRHRVDLYEALREAGVCTDYLDGYEPGQEEREREALAEAALMMMEGE